jgi:acyl carrier protein
VTRETLQKIILNALSEICPEADLSQLQPSVSFRDQLDIDSMDFLNFIIAVHKATKVDIPEKDYAKLFALNDCVDYLFSRVQS